MKIELDQVKLQLMVSEEEVAKRLALTEREKPGPRLYSNRLSLA